MVTDSKESFYILSNLCMIKIMFKIEEWQECQKWILLEPHHLKLLSVNEKETAATVPSVFNLWHPKIK